MLAPPKRRPFLLASVLGTVALVIMTVVKVYTTAGLPGPLIDVSALTNSGLGSQTHTFELRWVAVTLLVYLGIGVLYAFLALKRQGGTPGGLVMGSATAASVASFVASLFALVLLPIVAFATWDQSMPNLSAETRDQLQGYMVAGAALIAVIGALVGLIASSILGAIGGVLGIAFFRRRTADRT